MDWLQGLQNVPVPEIDMDWSQGLQNVPDPEIDELMELFAPTAAEADL